MAKIVNSWNEWDPLKRIILGSAWGTHQPKSDISWNYDAPTKPGWYGRMPEEMEAKAIELMNGFQKILEGRGVTVDRPQPFDTTQKTVTPDWECEVQRGFQPCRDVFFCTGNEIMEATMSIRARWFEYIAFRDILENYFHNDPEFSWVSAPKPRLTDQTFEPNWWFNYKNVWSDEVKKERMMKRQWHTTNKEPLFDAADGIRFGKDIFWNVSAISNQAGIDWLRRHFNNRGLRLHEIQFGGDYHHWHIDVCIMPLRPGLCIYNPYYMYLTPQFEELLKKNDWEMIPAVQPTHKYNMRIGTLNERVGLYWISMNTLSIDPKTICVEAHETGYQEQMNKLGLEVIPVDYADQVAFGGSLHCSTVDVYREGGCEDYFPNQVAGY